MKYLYLILLIALSAEASPGNPIADESIETSIQHGALSCVSAGDDGEQALTLQLNYTVFGASPHDFLVTDVDSVSVFENTDKLVYCAAGKDLAVFDNAKAEVHRIVTEYFHSMASKCVHGMREDLTVTLKPSGGQVVLRGFHVFDIGLVDSGKCAKN